MEAVPRMPMIAFELKNCSEIVEFTPALKQCIADVYHENPNAYSKECAEFDQLRLAAVRVSRDFMGCSTLKKYYAQLQFLRSRFPMSEDGALGIPFTWDDVYTGRAVTNLDIRFEQGSILYNIGALHSLLGAMDSRHNPEGMKVSCTHFQCAAWAFQQLRDCFEQNMSPDMNYDLLTFMFNLMLAQAQECILEKSMTDNRKSSITAKVAAQITDYYQQALKYLDACNAASITGSKRYKEWKKRIELKMNYHQCIVYYYQGCQVEDQEKWGERVTFFKAAIDKLNEAVKLAKGEDTEINEALKFTMDVVGGKYNIAKKENDFIYYDKVPPLDSLPEVKGAQLVKGIPFNYNDPEISGPDIFKKLVPIEAHEASSLYSEEKAKLLRRICGLIEEKNEELQQFLSSLQLDPKKIKPTAEPLPQLLLEKCAAISVKPNAIKDLIASMTSLSNVSVDVEGNISDIIELLDRAESIQKELGDKQHKSALEERRKECLKYKEGLAKASESNNELHKAMSAHVDNLRLLIKPLDELRMALPSADHNLTAEDEEVIEQMNKLMSKVDEMKNQRTMFEDQLRKQIQEDDITNVLVTREVSNLDEFFQEQLKKHDKEVALIEQNISAQDNILKALTEANAKYAKIRKQMEETELRRNAKVDALIQSYDVYEDLLAKCQKGVEFYNKLQRNVQTLSEQVQNLYQQLEEKKMLTEQTKSKAVSSQGPAIDGSTSNSVSSIPGMPPMPNLDTTTATVTPRLTLKDYLPFMKPATFGKKSAAAGENNAEQVASAIGVDAMDPHAVMAMYSGVTGGIGQVPQIPMNAGSLPNSHAASPVHFPKQPSSQPGSPGHLMQNVPRSDGGSNKGTMPGLPATVPHHVNGSAQAGLQPSESTATIPSSLPSASSGAASVPISAPSSLPTTGVSAQSVSDEQVLSPTSAPGAPSTKRPMPSSADHGMRNMGTPPGGPSAVAFQGEAQQSLGHSAAYWHQLPTSCPVSQTGVRHPTALAQISSVTTLPIPSASYRGIVHGGSGDPSQIPGQMAPPHSAQQNTGHYSAQLHQTGQNSSQQCYPQKAVSSSGVFMNQYSQYSSQHYQMPANASVAGAGISSSVAAGNSGFYNATVGMQSNQLSQANAVPGSVGQCSMGQAIQTGSAYGVPGSAVVTQHVIGEQRMNLTQPAQQVNGSPSVPTIPPQQAVRQPGTGEQRAPGSGQPAHPGVGQMGQQSQLSTAVPNQLAVQQQFAAAQPSHVSTGQPSHVNTGQPGHVSTGQPGQLATGQPGQLATGQPGQLATGQPGQMPTGQPGQMPTGHPGQMPTGHPGQLATGQPGQMATGQPGQMATGQPGQMATGQPGQMATGQPGQMATGQPGQMATGQPIQVNTLHPGQISGQASQRSVGQTTQVSVGQPGHVNTGQQGWPATGQQGQAAGGQQVYFGQPCQQFNAGWSGQQTSGQLGQSYGGQPSQIGVRPSDPRQAVQQGQTMAPQQGQMMASQQGQTVAPQQGQTVVSQQGQTVAPQQGQAAVVQPNQQSGPQQVQHVPRQLLPQQLVSGQASWGQNSATYMQTQSSNPYQAGAQPAAGTHAGSMGQNRMTTPGQYTVQSTTPGQAAIAPGQYQMINSSMSAGSITNCAVRASQQQSTSGHGPSYTYTHPSQQSGSKPQYGSQSGYTQQTGQYPVYQLGSIPQQQQQPQQPQPQQPQPQQPQPQQQQQHHHQQQQQQQQHPPQQLNQRQDPAMLNLPSPLQPMEMSLGAAASQSGALPMSQPVGQQQQQPQYPERASSLPPLDTTTANTSRSSQVKLSQVTSSSLDDLLSSSPERSRNGSPLRNKDVLMPKVITEQEIREQREEQIKNSLKQSATHDPYTDQEVLNKFVAEVEKYEKFLDIMMKETLSGPTPLDKEWKELAESQEKEAKKHSMAIARCYPLKNRFPDIMPYDSTRVILKGGKDDYINANHLGDLSPFCPKFIATQAPLPATVVDFWQMVYEQGTEVIVVLCQEHEAGKKNHVYWPAEKGQTITHGPFTLYLQSSKEKQGWMERIITLTHKETRHSRSVVHLQFLHWPSGGIPASPAVLLQFICEVHMFFIQQRNLVKPVIVHCSNGVDRTGAFCVIYAGVQEINQGHGLVSITNLVKQLREKRKYMVGDKELLKFCHSALLYYAQDLLMKRGILTNCASFSGKKTHQRHPSEDFILGTNINLNTIQSSVAKMKVQSPPSTSASSTSSSSVPSTTAPSEDTVNKVAPCDNHTDHSKESCADPENLGKGNEADKGTTAAQQAREHGPATSSKPEQVKDACGGGGGGDVGSKDKDRVLSNLPPSLAELQNPNTFHLEVTPPSKRKITKSSFLNPGSQLADKPDDPDDPLNSLDPLWTMKHDKA